MLHGESVGEKIKLVRQSVWYTSKRASVVCTNVGLSGGPKFIRYSLKPIIAHEGVLKGVFSLCFSGSNGALSLNSKGYERSGNDSLLNVLARKVSPFLNGHAG